MATIGTVAAMRDAKRVVTVALWAMPFLTVAVVSFAIFEVGAPRPYLGVRVLGGPTEGARRLSLYLMAVERLGEVERPAPVAQLTVVADAGGGRASWTGRLDEQGAAEVALELPAPIAGGVLLSVRSGERLLGQGRLELGVEAWSRAARRRGGWLRGQPSGALAVRVAAARGAFAVPFRDPLLVEVHDGKSAVAGSTLVFSPEGVDIGRARGVGATTDDAGRASIGVTPNEHAVAMRVDARAIGGKTGALYSVLPVVPGALHATLEGPSLRVESPVPRDRAYFALVTRTARLGGGAARLAADGRGGAVAVVDIRHLLTASEGADVWAVVSSEPDLRTSSTVGWPVRVGEVPASTFDAGNLLLLDDLPRAFQEDVARRQRARLLAGLFSLLSLVLVVTLMRLRVRSAEQALADHLRRAGSSEEDVAHAQTGRTLRWLIVAGLCLALGFTVIALFAMLRIG